MKKIQISHLQQLTGGEHYFTSRQFPYITKKGCQALFKEVISNGLIMKGIIGDRTKVEGGKSLLGPIFWIALGTGCALFTNDIIEDVYVAYDWPSGKD